MIWYDMTWYDMIWYDVMWCDVMWCDLMWCDVMWYDTIWCGYCIQWHVFLPSLPVGHDFPCPSSACRQCIGRGMSHKETESCRHLVSVDKKNYSLSHFNPIPKNSKKPTDLARNLYHNFPLFLTFQVLPAGVCQHYAPHPARTYGIPGPRDVQYLGSWMPLFSLL